MECSNLDCDTKEEQVFCEGCWLRVYCSQKCKEEDWKAFHGNWCGGSFDLDDLHEISDNYIGKGSFGEVKLVMNKKTMKLFALKTVKKEINEKNQLKQIFKEISIQKKMNNKNVIKLFHHLETSNQVLMLLEYGGNRNLNDLLMKKRRLPECEAFKYFKQLCKGLQYLHDNYIIHRDIKPENLLINESGVLKICDFGLSTFESAGETTFCGSLDYMAPEVFNEREYSSKVDVWALGVILYEMINGKKLFKGMNFKEKVKKIQNDEFCFNKSSSKASQNLVKRLLNLNPELRPDIIDVLSDEWVLRYEEADCFSLYSRSSLSLIYSSTQHSEKHSFGEYDFEDMNEEINIKLEGNQNKMKNKKRKKTINEEKDSFWDIVIRYSDVLKYLSIIPWYM